jgi:phosphoribosyl 1,2-cyclic phosphodiesterase
MAIRFTVLASGSAGNASLVQTDGFGLLLDAGLGPRQLAGRLAAVGASWDKVNAVLLSHTHGDHWHNRTLAHLRRRQIPLYCHASHHAELETYSSEFALLRADGLVRTYEANEVWKPSADLCCRAVPLLHDCEPTFGFRLEQSAELLGQPFVLGYAADLGSWTPELVDAFADADVLALEFNHDVQLQHASGRSFQLIRRILGDRGHLSNVQAAALLDAVLRQAPPGRLRHLVQLHLSRDCNRPELAIAAARAVIADQPIEVHTASQDMPILTVGSGGARMVYAPRRRARLAPPRRTRSGSAIAWLPGMEP